MITVVISRPGRVVKNPVAPIPIPGRTTDQADKRCSFMIKRAGMAKLDRCISGRIVL